jgi:hypothetical protein
MEKESTDAPEGDDAAFDPERAPLENPDIDVGDDDPLLEPHPDEPGVTPEGSAAPIENPGWGREPALV